MPAPVFSRRSFTIAEVTSAICDSLLGLLWRSGRFRRGGSFRLRRQGGLVLHDGSRGRFRFLPRRRPAAEAAAPAASVAPAAAGVAPPAPLGGLVAILAFLALRFLR